MRLLKTVLDFYLRSSLHVAVCFVALLRIVKAYGVFYFKPELYVLAFCLIVVSYNFIKYIGLVYKRENFLFKRLIVLLSIICIIPILWLILNDHFKAWFILGVISVLVIFYTIPFYRGRSLRYGVFFKVLTVVFSWCLLLVIFPLYSDYAIKRTITCSWHRPDWILYLLRSIQLISFVFALCIPFEIRDLKYDSFKVKTLPQVIGIKNTKRLGYTLVSVLLFIQFLIYTQTNLLELDIILTFIVLGMAIYFSDKFKSDYYASFFVEAIPLLWLGMYWVF